MRLKADAAQSIVNRPFPRRIGMSVENNSSFGFTGAFLDRRHIVSRLFGENLVDRFEVKSELKQGEQKSEGNKYNRYNRGEEIEHDRRKNKGEREEKPAKKGAWVFLERLNIRSLAATVLFKSLCHILAGLFFPD